MARRRQLFLLALALTLLICGITSADQVQYNHYTATYGAICKDACEKQGYAYYWCNTRNGWDYCSPDANTDYYDDECKDESPCGKHGQNYYWCYTKCPSKPWEMCGLVEPKSVTYISSKHQSTCTDDCVYDANYEYFWCHTNKGWDFCSPIHDVTYQNEPCLPGYPCGTYGYSYSWCKTKSGWDYCGVINAGECTFYNSQRKKRQTSRSNTFADCTRSTKGRDVVTSFSTEQNSNALADGSAWKSEITHLISRWDNECLEDSQAKSELITSDNFRIGKLNDVKVRNQRSYILHVQKKDNANTKVAQLSVTDNALTPISNQYMRIALLESLRRRAKVTVEVKKERK